jgi:hypothetical protein
MAYIGTGATTGERIDGRPDFANHDFGETYAKTFPPYVFSTRHGALVHQVASVELDWWAIGPGGYYLERMVTPRIGARTKCGTWILLKGDRARTCRIPSSDALLCEACQGTGRNFGRDGSATKAGITYEQAHVRLGCIVAGY